MTKDSTGNTTIFYGKVEPGTMPKASKKLRKFRGYKELVPDPYGLSL